MRLGRCLAGGLRTRGYLMGVTRRSVRVWGQPRPRCPGTAQGLPPPVVRVAGFGVFVASCAFPASRSHLCKRGVGVHGFGRRCCRLSTPTSQSSHQVGSRFMTPRFFFFKIDLSRSLHLLLHSPGDRSPGPGAPSWSLRCRGPDTWPLVGSWIVRLDPNQRPYGVAASQTMPLPTRLQLGM